MTMPSVALEPTVLFGPDELYPFYRIPSLLAINATLLLAFAEGRGQRNDHGRVSIVLKRSFDGGQSWSPQALVEHGMSGTIGNPTPLYDDEIALFFCHENKDVYLTRSPDLGISWSTPERIKWSRPSEWHWVATGPPAALLMQSGRWVLPCDGLAGSRQLYSASRVFSFVLYSDDRGATWQQGELLDGGNECQAAQLPNGSLVLNMRSKHTVRLHSLSIDGGEHWSQPRKATPPVTDGETHNRSNLACVPAQGAALVFASHVLAPALSLAGNCQGSQIALTSGTSPLLLATSVSLGRRGLTARTSRDGGLSWAVHATLERGQSGYSALADLGGGWAGCLYEWTREKAPTAGGGTPSKPTPRRKNEEGVLAFVRFNVTAASREVDSGGQAGTEHVLDSIRVDSTGRQYDNVGPE